MFEEDSVWLEHRSRFAEIYDNYNYSSPLQAWVMRASHKLIEKNFTDHDYFDKVIEVGAGTGEHYHLVRHKFGHYLLTDMDHKTLDIASKKLAAEGEKTSFKIQEGNQLAYPDHSFDRLIAVHVLEHIYEPHLALKEWRRVIKPGGVLSVLIPTDPGLAWRLGRNMGPRRNAIRQGLAYDYLMAREHVNSCNNLIALLRHYFPVANESWWPLKVPSIDLNLFFGFNAKIAKD